jgi:hypothetical protein
MGAMETGTARIFGADMDTSASLEVSHDDAISVHWRRWLLLIWLLTCGYFLFNRWGLIHWFVLPDTDDNMRMMQVRGLLNGQAWYDLRQHRLDPPLGANIHWSRLVDLPIAVIILITKPFVGTMMAEKIAAAVAPMLPLGVAMFGMAVAVRRLVHPKSFAFAAALMVCAQSAVMMFMPMRIDHHNWQLTFLVLAVAGLADDRKVRGGLTVGLASAASLTIGLEMMVFLATSGAAVALRWIIDRGEAERLRAYALALSAGSALGYVVFASNDNANAVCDALSPVWLSAMVGAGALAFLLSYLRADKMPVRLVCAAVVGAVTAISFAVAWPDCLGRPEHISPELGKLWFNNIREAKPLYLQDMVVALSTITLPVIGLIGSLWATWQARRRPVFGAWLPVAFMSLSAVMLCLWQTRMGPSAQLLAVPGATALMWATIPRLRAHSSVLVRTFGVVAAFLLLSGLIVQLGLALKPTAPPTKWSKAVDHAWGSCMSQASMETLNRVPAATILTFVDIGPRLITMTHHNALAGPYHRNGATIIDIHHAFRGTPETARAVMTKHGATMLLTCPMMSEATVFTAQNPKGFYGQLNSGKIPDWLDPVALPKGSPYRLWRLKQG